MEDPAVSLSISYCTLEVGKVISSEKVITCYQSTLCHVLEDRSLKPKTWSDGRILCFHSEWLFVFFTLREKRCAVVFLLRAT
jgi:hypothetical protein